MVGSYAKKVFCDDEVVMTDLPEIDVTDKDSISTIINAKRPKIVLHLAAETDVDRCETDPEHAQKVNVKGAENTAIACKEAGAIMIYISTGYVFNGKARQAHTEYDKTGPVNVYGRSKLEGELRVKDILKEQYVFRADWMIGGGAARDKKFVGKIIEQCKTKKEIEAVDDMFGSPTFARDFLEGIKVIIKTGSFGLYHLANIGVCSRYEMALEIVKKLKADVKVLPVPSSRFPLAAPRAQSSGLRNYKSELMGLKPMPEWKDSLREYIKEWQ